MREHTFISGLQRQAAGSLHYLIIFAIWLLVREVIPDQNLNPLVELVLFSFVWLSFSAIVALVYLRPEIEVQWKYLGSDDDFFFGPHADVALNGEGGPAYIEVRLNSLAQNGVARWLLSRTCNAQPQVVLEFAPPEGIRVVHDRSSDSLVDKVDVRKHQVFVHPALHGHGREGWFAILLMPEPRSIGQIFQVHPGLQYEQQGALGYKLARARSNVSQLRFVRTTSN